jgi:hypothetical protein
MYAISVLGRYTAQPSMLQWEAIKDLLHNLRGTCEWKLTIYDQGLQHDSNSIVCYADANLGREADSSKSTSGIIILALGILVLWRWKTRTVLAQSTLRAEMIDTAYGKVQLHWLRDVISEIELGADMTRSIFNDGLNCITTLQCGNFRSESQHLRLQCHMIHEAIAKSEIEIKHVAGMDILAGALTKALGGVKLGKFAKGTWSKVDGLGMELGRHWTWDVEDKEDICFGIAFSFVLFAVFEFSFILLHSLSF